MIRSALETIVVALWRLSWDGWDRRGRKRNPAKKNGCLGGSRALFAFPFP